MLFRSASSDISAIALQPLRIDEILWETRTELINRKNDYKISIEFSHPIDDETELIINGNLHLLKIAIANLMDNGCKFSESRSVEVFLSAKNGRIEIEFVDKGIGIDSADLDKVFHPFYRANAAKNIAGNGLGLALSSKIISLHRGTISVQSQPGKGTKVTVDIPLIS